MSGKIAYTQPPFGLRVNIGLTVLRTFNLNNSFTAVTLFNNRLKCTVTIFSCFNGLHNANLLKKYHFSLESGNKLPYNTTNCISTILGRWILYIYFNKLSTKYLQPVTL